jgi:hypothetical protein
MGFWGNFLSHGVFRGFLSDGIFCPMGFLGSFYLVTMGFFGNFFSWSFGEISDGVLRDLYLMGFWGISDGVFGEFLPHGVSGGSNCRF